MAMPRATLNIKTVDGFILIPSHPIMPAVITKGIMFGINEQIKIRNERKRYIMHKAIRPNAQRMLSFNPLIIKSLPVRKVTLAPVSWTL